MNTLPQIDIKTLAPCVEIKVVKDTGEFEGYGSTFGGKPDSYGDIVAPGAFHESLAKHKAAGTWPAMLFNHDPSKLIGEWTEIREDARGLFVRGKLWIDGQTPDPDALKAHRAMKANQGRLGLSIGFRTLDFSFDKATNTRTLTKVDLWEISATAFPANDAARVVSAKSIPSPSDLERILRDAGLSRSQAKALLAEGYKAAATRRDAGVDPALTTQLVADLRSGAAAIRSLIIKG